MSESDCQRPPKCARLLMTLTNFRPHRSETGLLSFSELSLMLWQLRHGLSLRQSRAEAVDTLLFLDTDSER